MDLLDVSKENIQPLKRGRNMSALSNALQAQTDMDVHQQLMKKREEFEVLVRSYSGDDPLQPWYDYVQWVEQSFPKHGREGNLKVLLENCLTQFKDLEQYHQDVRFIDLWTIYMTFVDDPLQVYKQIHAKGIGSECAIFYQCWAEEYEKAKDMKRADQVFIEGIRRKAQPLDELITAHTNFQIRIARNVLGQNPVINQEVSVERTALSTLRAHGRKRNLVDSNRVGNSIKHTTPGVLRPSSGFPLGERKIGNMQKSKMTVYNDENAPYTDAVANPKVEPSVSLPKQSANKENTLKPGRWNEGKVKKSAARAALAPPPSALRTPTFQVHVDESCETPKTPKTDIVASNVLKMRRRVYEDEKEIPVAMFEPYDPTKKPMYPKNKVYSGGSEFSLEELRAIIYFQREEERKKACTNVEKLDDKSEAMSEDHSSEVHVESNANLECTEEQQIEPVQDAIGIAADANDKHIFSQPFGFEVFVESEEEMKTKLKLEPKQCVVQKERKTVVSTQQFKEVPISGCLKVPGMLKGRKETLIQTNETYRIGPSFEQTYCDQSLTVNTKAVLNDVKGMWSSSPPADRNIAREPVVSKFAKPFETVQYPTEVLATPLIPFKIFNDTSTLESKQSNEVNVHTSQSSAQDQVGSSLMSHCEKGENSITRQTLHNSCNYSEQKSAVISDNEAHIDICDAMKKVSMLPNSAKYVGGNEIPKSAPQILPQNIASRNCEPAEYPPAPTEYQPAEDKAAPFPPMGIPFVPSPGTSSHHALDDNTEDKENALKGKNERRTLVCKSKNNILQPSKDIYFVPLEQQIEEEEQQGQGQVLSDETCCTEAFAMPLVCSTPIVNPYIKGLTCKRKEQKEENDEADDNTIALMNWVMQDKRKTPGLFNTDHDSSKFCKGLLETEKEKEVVPSAQLSTILELSEQKRCSSTGTSDGSNVSKSRGMDAAHRYANNKRLFAASPASRTIAEELGIDDYFAEEENSNKSSTLPFFSNQLRENWLNEIGFPSEVHCHRCKLINKEWDMKVEKYGPLLIGEKCFFVIESLSKENTLNIVASESNSNQFKMLELKNNSYLWEQYIREEIRMRLQNLSMAKHFDFIEEMYLFSNKHIVVSNSLHLKDLKDFQEGKINLGGSEYNTLSIIHEIISIIAYLHQCQIVHGNLSIMSFKLAVGNSLHLVLSEFEKAVDLKLIPANTVFDVTGNATYSILNASKVSPFQVDYIAVAGVLHTLIFGETLKVKKEKGIWMTALPLPRGFEEHIWREVFVELLNHSEVDLFHLNEVLKQTLESGK